MNNQKTTEEELMEADNTYWVTQHKALKELEANPNFQLVIKEGYFKDRAVNTVSMLATDYVRKSGTRPELFETLVGISGLEDHFAMIHSLGSVAQDEQLEADGLVD